MRILGAFLVALSVLPPATARAQSLPSHASRFAQQVVYQPLESVQKDRGQLPAALSRTISLKVKRAPLSEVLQSIAAKAGLGISYGEDLARAAPLVTLRVEDVSVADALESAVRGTGWSVLVTASGQVTAVKRPTAQAVAVTGRVTDAATGAGLAGAQVVVVGTQLGAQAGPEGRFTISGIQPGRYRIRASYVGYVAAEQSVTVTATQGATVDFGLSQQVVQLEKVVAVGYGTSRTRDITGAIGSVSAQELDKVQAPSIAQVLQGRVAGVEVTQNSAAPGGGVSIRIRGSGSIGSTNEPLYVVDGIPISGGDNNNPTSSRSRPGTMNPLAFLDPSDIASIEVLKDASSTAIYGARGTNGVVLVTTKKGRPGSSRIEFESSVGLQQVAKKMPVLNGREWAEMANEWAALEELSAPYPDLSTVGNGIDYQDLIYQNALTQEHSVNMLGGTEQTRFSLSGSFADQRGIVRSSGFRRYSLRTSVQHQAKSWLNLGTNLNVSRLKPRLGFTDAAGSRAAASAVNAATAFVPLMPIYNENGEYTWMDRDFLPELVALGENGTNYENPLAIINEETDQAEYDRVLGNLFAEATLLDGLTLRLNGGANIIHNTRSEYFTRRSRRGGQAHNGVAEVGNINGSNYLAESILNYRKSFGDTHRVDLTAGTTYEHNARFSSDVENENFPNDITRFYDIGAGTPEGGPDVGSGWSDWTLLSYLGRANYSLADRYLFTITGRADGSSKFGASNKWGYFPSAALAWRASEEPFIQKLGLFSDLKLRVSYGLTGNQEIGNYQSLARLRGANYNFGGTLLSGYYPNSVANPDLRWEKSRQFDAGIDAAFLDSRVSLTVDVYRKITDDLLLEVPLPLESGFSSALQNLGSVKNQGAEMALGVDVLDAVDGGLGWHTSLNVSANRNTVLEIGDRDEIIGSDISNDMKVGGSLVREGEPMGIFFGYRTDGIFHTQAEADSYVGPDGQPILPGAVAGQRKIVDMNGDGTINADDRVILGNPEPDFSFGWTNDFSLGPVGLYTFFQGTYGNEVFDVNLQELSGAGVDRNMWAPAWKDRWTPENPNAKWPSIGTPRGTGYSAGVTTTGEIFDTFIEDGSYLRLKSLMLTLDVPDRLAGRIGGIQNARLFFNAENVFTLTHYMGMNPDVNTSGQDNINRGIDLGAYPLARTYRIGVRFGL